LGRDEAATSVQAAASEAVFSEQQHNNQFKAVAKALSVNMLMCVVQRLSGDILRGSR
jgi:hypothetical protein